MHTPCIVSLYLPGHIKNDYYNKIDDQFVAR